ALRDTYATLLVRQREEAQRLAELEREMAGLQVALAQSLAERDGITEALDLFTAQMAEVIAERDEASAAETALNDTVTTLEGELDRWETRQSRFLSQLETAARVSLTSLQKVFDRANIDLDRILAQTRRDYSGKGGLFEPLEDGAEAAPDPRVAALMTDLERVNLMRLAADRLPFGRPVRGARLTSGFGPRRDPFRGHTAMHSGIDWAAPRGTPIYATANGVVSFVGRMSGYGIVVKIKHAFGYETLYAHLSRARVDVGQHVERGDRIADMGNTGRSTGPHLHYEIRVNKEPVNPAKFIEAARDVL
ncbi:MAG: peptidoglycan DD-metalloendopeptidase family protein, partial [Pseudomonadota bacterium]